MMAVRAWPAMKEAYEAQKYLKEIGNEDDLVELMARGELEDLMDGDDDVEDEDMGDVRTKSIKPYVSNMTTWYSYTQDDGENMIKELMHVDMFTMTFFSMQEKYKKQHRVTTIDQANYFFECLMLLMIELMLFASLWITEFAD